MVRDDAQADVVSARGAKPHVVDLHDRPAVAAVLRGADGAIHTASPGDTTSAALDAAVVDAAIDALAGTGKPYLQQGQQELVVQLHGSRVVSREAASS